MTIAISALPAIVTAAGADVIPIVDAGTTSKITIANLFASPPAIGGTTPAAGTFTRVIVTGATVPANGMYLSAANTLAWATNTTLGMSLLANQRLLLGTTVDAGGILQVGGSGESAYFTRAAGANTNAPNIRIRKARGTVAAPSIVANGDFTGFLSFEGYDGAAYIPSAQIHGLLGTGIALNNMSGYLIFSTNSGGAGVTEKARLTPSGNLIIGTNVETASAGLIQLATGTTAAFGIVAGTDTQLYRAGAASWKTNAEILLGTSKAIRFFDAGAAETGYIAADSNGLILTSKGTQPAARFFSDDVAAEQVRILRTASATNYLTLTGSNGGNPTIGTSGGNLAITPIINAANKIYPGTDAAAAQTSAGLYANVGAPNNANGANGDFYFRSDGGALTTIYQRRAGAWVGIV